MAFVVTKERASGSLTNTTYPYIVTEDNPALTIATASEIQSAINAATAQAAIDNSTAPTTYTWQSLSNTAIRVNCIWQQATLNKLTLQASGSVSKGFRYQAPPETILKSKKLIGQKYLWDFFPKVGIVGDAMSHRIVHRGVQVVPRVTDWYHLIQPVAAYTDAYRLIVANLMGLVNSVTFDSRPAGSYRFVSCTSQARTDDDWAITFGFDYRPNYEIVISGEGPTTVWGHDIDWTYDETTYDEDGLGSGLGIVTIVEKNRFIDRVFASGDFSALGI